MQSQKSESEIILSLLSVDDLQHTISLVDDTVALSRLAKTCRFFREEMGPFMLKRRKQEYQEIILLLERY